MRGFSLSVLMWALASLLAQHAVAQHAVAQPAVAPGGGRAFMTAAQLLALCKNENPYCTQYVAAVADTLAPLSEPGGPLPPNSLASFCPQTMTVKQAIEAFQKFAKANPEGLSLNAAIFVGDALHAAFPCKRG